MLDKVADVFFHPIVQTIFMALLGILFAWFKKYKDLYNEFIDIPKKVREARKASSVGGKKIMESEWAEIGKETVQFIDAAAKVDWKTVLASVFKKGK